MRSQSYALGILAVLCSIQESAAAQASDGDRPPYQLSLGTRPWQGDLDAMLERRLIRVLVPSSRTLFFVERGHPRGITADVVTGPATDNNVGVRFVEREVGMTAINARIHSKAFGEHLLKVLAERGIRRQ